MNKNLNTYFGGGTNTYLGGETNSDPAVVTAGKILTRFATFRLPNLYIR